MDHSGMIMAGSYDGRLVALSILVAIFASYTALDLASRVAATAGRAQAIWIGGGALAMGIGIWSMHFTGMLAFSLPMDTSYDLPIVLLSMLAAVGASGVALFVASRATMGATQLLLGGAVMGAGIVTMHYSGMAAMQMPATITYNPTLLALSVAIAMGASIAALLIAFRLRFANPQSERWMKPGSAVVMGIAIVGMHYTGMAAAIFTPTSAHSGASAGTLNTFAIALGVALVTLVILGLAVLSALVDRRLSAQSRAIESGERRYRALVEQNPDAILAFDTAGVLLSGNPASERMTGYSLDELSAAPLLSLVAAEDAEQVQERFRLAALGRPQHCEATIITKAGERAELSLTFVSIAEAGGQAWVYLIGRDVTERRSAERAVQESEANLRTILGQQAQLVQTIKALSTPVLPIHDRVLVVPLVGQLDAERGAQVTEALLAGIERQHAQIAILDITGVPIVDQETASHLLQATEAARLLGAQCLLVGVSPEVAQALVQVGASLDSLLTLRDLQAGIDYALSRYRRPATLRAAPSS